jgi:hypothetical protein
MTLTTLLPLGQNGLSEELGTWRVGSRDAGVKWLIGDMSIGICSLFRCDFQVAGTEFPNRLGIRFQD